MSDPGSPYDPADAAWGPDEREAEPARHDSVQHDSVQHDSEQRGPDFAPPDPAAQPAQTGAYGFTPDPAWQPPGRDRTRTGTALVLIGALALALSMIIAIGSVVYVRQLSQTGPSSPPASPPPPPTSAPELDPIAERLTMTGMACVPAYPDPRITVCMARPGTTHADIRWLSDPVMREFRIYHKAEEDIDHVTLVRRLQALTRGGPSIDDIGKIDDGMARARDERRHVTVKADWGVMEIEYIETLTAFQVEGRIVGSPQTRVPGRPFDSSEVELSSALAREGFECTDESYELSCAAGTSSLHLYRTGPGTARYDYVTLYDREQQPGAVRPDDALIGILDELIGTDSERVVQLITANGAAEFYLGAAAGYLVRIEPDSIDVEVVRW